MADEKKKVTLADAKNMLDRLQASKAKYKEKSEATAREFVSTGIGAGVSFGAGFMNEHHGEADAFGIKEVRVGVTPATLIVAGLGHAVGLTEFAGKMSFVGYDVGRGTLDAYATLAGIRASRVLAAKTAAGAKDEAKPAGKKAA